MAHVVVKGALITCSHAGELAFVAGHEAMTVGGNGVVLAGGEVGMQFLAPPLVPGGPKPCSAVDASNHPAPCKIQLAATEGLSTTLKVGGKAVLLDSAKGATFTTAGPGTTWSVKDAGQSVMDAS
jgi:hypothetical protein